MNFDRIRPSVSVDRMLSSHAVVVGGAYGLACDLARCGLGAITLVDYDRVEAANPARQDLYSTDLGRFKVEATAANLRRINPDMDIETHVRDLCSIPRDEFDELFGHTDLFIDGADSFLVHARMNQVVIGFQKRPASAPNRDPPWGSHDTGLRVHDAGSPRPGAACAAEASAASRSGARRPWAAPPAGGPSRFLSRRRGSDPGSFG